MGEPGPGGGVVFYANPSGFACGPTLTSTCKYLESAPITGAGAWTDALYNWTGSSAHYSAIGSDAQGTAIGTGYKNTLAMVSQDSTASRAGTASRGFGGPNNLTDWYLPSKDELNALCKWAFSDNVNTVCNNSGSGSLTLVNGGFSAGDYWSSSEDDETGAWGQDFTSGGQFNYFKDDTYYVRPVRAF